MVRKNYKWNISIEEGKKIVDDKITSILTDRGKTELSELNFLILSRSRDITIENNKKKKNLQNYIRNVLGGLRNYLELSKNYDVTQKGIEVFVDIKKESEGEDIYFLNDWVIVE
jgi:hypothetical protein